MSRAAYAKNETVVPGTEPVSKLRFVTAASLFDGHDASINIMRRLLQAKGVEVIHLGHNRAVHEIINAAIQEDANGIAVSSYQGGHIEYFKFMIDTLRQQKREDIKVFGGGGGVIIPTEITELENYGVNRIYSPADGQEMGLEGMIEDMIDRCQSRVDTFPDLDSALRVSSNWRELSRLLSHIENNTLDPVSLQQLRSRTPQRKVPVLGITGTGGSGKSSLTDEIVLRFRLNYEDQLNIAILAIDPSRRKTGGALLGDRIRMNAIDSSKIYMRSLATRDATGEVPDELPDIIQATRLSGFDLVIVETPGIGQGDAGIVPMVDVSLYVMTPEFGAASQLEKIDMLDFADIVAINKFDRRGAHDALRDVRKQLQRNRKAFSRSPDEMPVYGTMASHFNDAGTNALYHHLLEQVYAKGLEQAKSRLPVITIQDEQPSTALIPGKRQRYLAEIADCVRDYHQRIEQQALIARKLQHLDGSRKLLVENKRPTDDVDAIRTDISTGLDANCKLLLDQWPELQRQYTAEQLTFKVRGKEVVTDLQTVSLSGTRIPKVALPGYHDQGDLLSWLMSENLPGRFPYTAGVFPFKREEEDPTRMFAGEGDAFRTNRRFKYLSRHTDAKRLSTAFDSVTLYGRDPDIRPDIYGKIGNSGVSIATLEDLKVLYDGFDLCDPRTSVSMTINGPAPTILAMFINVAIDQQMEKFRSAKDRQPTAKECQDIRELALTNVRGTVQADILKEDQGQNTCIFSTEFSLKVMGDIQEYFINHDVRNFYSVSISGYHIAEAGANPITQLALTLANGFTYVEAYLARGMSIDDFAANLSFFFSNGMDPEYTVMGRVARRIWAITMRDCYGANDRSQKLKYHIQTSGRSLHAQEMDFNDIRTTLQALIAVYDNCNSLHTNAHDEAITTPTEDSVRRAVAIQLIINREWGLTKNENSNQGAFIIEELTDLVEEAVLSEFERIAERGGVLGAMETGYQRGKIQEESLYYEHRKHDGSLPIIGVNTFLKESPENTDKVELARSTEDEKQGQIKRLEMFHRQHAGDCENALKRVQQAAIENSNVFAELVNAVRYCSLGQITDALFDVGGRYRRNM